MRHTLSVVSRILTVNVGRSVPTEHSGVPTTGIDKQPVESIEVRDPGPKHGGLGSGVLGDAVDDVRHHGGSSQAVYAVAREELDWWEAELGRELRSGMFGENLTTEGLDVDAAVLGTTWRVGSAVLRVDGPRIPCRTFAGHMGEQGWVKRFTERGRTGAYLAALEPGTITAGDPVEVVAVPEHGFTVPQAFRALMGDRELAAAIVAAATGLEQVHGDLETRLAKWQR